MCIASPSSKSNVSFRLSKPFLLSLIFFTNCNSRTLPSHRYTFHYHSMAKLGASIGLNAITYISTAASTFTPTFLESDYDSEVSFAQSPSTVSRTRVIRQRVASMARSVSSGYQMEVSRSSSDKENEDSVSGSRTLTGSYTPGSGSLSLNGSGSYGSRSYLDSRSRTPTGYRERLWE